MLEKKEMEIRSINLRTTDPGTENKLMLEGSPILFETPTKINDVFGSYTEIIKRGALNNTDLSDIKLLYNHDINRLPLARTPNTMNLSVDNDCVKIRAELPDTEEGKSIYTAVKRADLTGMSFAFKVAKNGDSFDSKTNTRTITNIEKVFEVSVVPFPAYQQTSVSARSAMTGLNKQKEQLKIKVNQILKRRV